MEKKKQMASPGGTRKASSTFYGIICLLAGAALLVFAFSLAFVLDTGGTREIPRLAPKSIRGLYGLPGASQVIKVTLINRHGATAHDLAVDATCGCVIPSIDTQDLAPRGEVVVTLHVTFAGEIGKRDVTMLTRYVVEDNLFDEMTSLTFFSQKD